MGEDSGARRSQHCGHTVSVGVHAGTAGMNAAKLVGSAQNCRTGRGQSRLPGRAPGQLVNHASVLGLSPALESAWDCQDVPSCLSSLFLLLLAAQSGLAWGGWLSAPLAPAGRRTEQRAQAPGLSVRGYQPLTFWVLEPRAHEAARLGLPHACTSAPPVQRRPRAYRGGGWGFPGPSVELMQWESPRWGEGAAGRMEMPQQ